MAGSNENNPNLIAQANNHVKPVGLPAGGGKILAPIGNNRRALRDISRNIIEAPSYPWAVNKRPFPERDATSAGNPPTQAHRPVTRRDATSAGNPPTQAHRPVTRRLASQMANMKQSTVEEILSSYGSVPTSSETEDMNSDNSVPMYVQHTEAMLEEIDRMDEEVEMEDIDEEEEPIIDIDRGDKNNPLAVIEYIDELYAYYHRTEASSCVPVNYMDSQRDINQKMRGILIDWLIEVHYKFDLMDETLYLTVNVIDRFLALRPVIRRKLQLVGVTAMLLACKYEEVSVPVVDDLILISDRAYTREELLEMESLIVNTLQFNLSVPTPYVFMRRFLKAAQIDPTLESVAYFIIELCLVEYEMLAFPPSLLAAAAVYTAQCTISRMRYWSKTSEWHTKYTEEQLMECAKMMVTFHQNSGIGKLTGVHRKYNTAKYGYAAKSEPALFLLDIISV